MLIMISTLMMVLSRYVNWFSLSEWMLELCLMRYADLNIDKCKYKDDLELMNELILVKQGLFYLLWVKM